MNERRNQLLVVVCNVACIVSLLAITSCVNHEALGINVPADFQPRPMLIDKAVVEQKISEDPIGVARRCPGNFPPTELSIINGFNYETNKDGTFRFSNWRYAEIYIEAITRASLYYLVSGDESAASYVADQLENYAENDAFQYIVSTHEAPKSADTYPLKTVVIPTFAAWDSIRNSPVVSERQHKVIEPWLTRVFRRVDVSNGRSPGLASNRNNHRYLRDTAVMQWGILTGSRGHFLRGVDGIIAALGQMRDDGSLPLETKRGHKATFYMRHATASLVTNAELALQQGVDLYAVKVNGKSLHDIVRFTLMAMTDSTVIKKYTTSAQYLSSFDQEWIALYGARFPDTDTGKLALAVKPVADDPYRNGKMAMMGGCIAFLKH